MSALVKANYKEMAVTFTEDAWFNATVVAEHYGKRPNDWMALDETKAYLAALQEFQNTILAGNMNCAKEGDSRIWVKTKRGKNGGTWMHPDLAVPFARWLDMRFGVWCDQQIKQILNGTHPHHDWKRQRHQTVISHKVINEILLATRTSQGKTCEAHHYSNEARLICWAFTGEFGSLDREALSLSDLDLLAKLEIHNSILIGSGKPYEVRKKALGDLASGLRAKRAPAIQMQGAAA